MNGQGGQASKPISYSALAVSLSLVMISTGSASNVNDQRRQFPDIVRAANYHLVSIHRPVSPPPYEVLTVDTV